MQCEMCWSHIGKNHVVINGKQTCEQCINDALKWFEKKERFYIIKEELHDAIAKRNLELHYIKKKLGRVNKFGSYHDSFFEYFLGFHAIVCTDKGCVCRASTFMDMICENKLRYSKEYGRLIEEILDRDR